MRLVYGLLIVTIAHLATPGFSQGDDLPSEAYVYFINVGTGIERTGFGGALREILIPQNPIIPQGLAIDPVNRHIYWTDWVADKIQRSDLNGGNVTDIITTGLNLPEGIAIDPVNEKIYWVDSGTKKVQRANLDGSKIEDLVTYTEVNLDGIALDIQRGFMFWTEWGDGGAVGKVKRANLDGSEVKEIIALRHHNLKGIDLDPDRQHIYLTECNFGLIFRIDYSGRNKLDLHQEMVTPNAMAIDLENEKIYWTDLGKRWLKRSNLDGSETENILLENLEKPQDIALFIGRLTTDTQGHTITQSNITLSPNPARNQLTINGLLDPGIGNIFNADGQLIQTIRLKTGTTTLDCTLLPKGHYWLQIITSKGSFQQQAFVIN